MADDTFLSSARRTVLKTLGAGAAAPTAGAGTVSGDPGGRPEKRPPVIDANLGYTQWDPDEVVPFEGTVDETVTLSQQNFGESRIPEAPAEFFFDPVGLSVDPGSVVEFSVQAGHHAVGSYHPDNDRQRRIPSDAPAFSSPMLGGYGNEEGAPEPGGESQSWYYRFETEGVYDLYCPPHEVFGMVMRIVVGDGTGTEPGPAGPQFLVPLEFADEIFAQPALEPETIVDRGRVAWEDLFPLESGDEDGDDGGE